MKPYLSGRPLHDPSGRGLQSTTHKNPAPSLGLSAVGALGAAHAHAPAAPAATAMVETIKQGDTIVRIIVTCACGERIEVDCLYPKKNA